MLQFLVGILGAYPIFYGLDRFARPALDGFFGAHDDPIGLLLHEINQMENRLSTQIDQCVADLHIAIAGCASEAVFRPSINRVIATWPDILRQGIMYGVNGETEWRALITGYQNVSIDIEIIFNNLSDVLQNTANVEKTFKLLMHVWRCALSVEALYLERQMQYGPDVPTDNAEFILKDRYVKYLENLQTTLVAVCIDRIRRNNIIEAIKAFEAKFTIEQYYTEIDIPPRPATIELTPRASTLFFIVENACKSGDEAYNSERMSNILHFGRSLREVDDRVLVHFYLRQMVGQIKYSNTAFAYPCSELFKIAAFIKSTRIEDIQNQNVKTALSLMGFPTVVERFFSPGGIYLHNRCLLDAGPVVHQRSFNGRLPHRDDSNPWNPYLLFQVIPIELGAFFILFNRKANVCLDGGPSHQYRGGVEGARGNKWTHWKPFIRPGVQNMLFFKCREGTNRYLTAKRNVYSHMSTISTPLNHTAEASWEVLQNLDGLPNDFEQHDETPSYLGWA